MAYTVHLTAVDSAPDGASILAPDQLPAFTGNEDEDLACGMCNGVIAKGVSTKTLHQNFAAPVQLMVKCTCGTLNIVPSHKVIQH